MGTSGPRPAARTKSPAGHRGAGCAPPAPGDNFSPHLTTRKDRRVGDRAKANNVEIAYTPTNSSWLNRIEAQFAALRYFTLDGTDHASHKEQASMIRRYIIWRNTQAYDE
jgi:transposase